MDKSQVKQSIIDVLRAVIFALLYGMLLVLLVSIIVKYTDMSDMLATALNQVIKVLAVVLGCITGFRSKKLGWLQGLLVGLLYTVLSFAGFSLISGQLKFSDVTVYDFLLGIATGLFAGILAVNLRNIDRPKRTGRRLRRAKA